MRPLSPDSANVGNPCSTIFSVFSIVPNNVLAKLAGGTPTRVADIGVGGAMDQGTHLSPGPARKVVCGFPIERKRNSDCVVYCCA